MSILILGESGAGKSTSVRTLPHEETFILNVIGKPLPFRGYKAIYKPLSSDGKTGNYYASDDHAKIMRVINLVNKSRPEIKYLIIDDFSYSITGDFMRRAMQSGYGKFSEIGKNAFDVIDAVTNLREDLFSVVTMHTEIDENGRYKPKTVGKMINQYGCIEGKFTYVFHALIHENEYLFLTNNDNVHMAHTPQGCFENKYVPNDLLQITKAIKLYNEGE